MWRAGMGYIPHLKALSQHLLFSPCCFFQDLHKKLWNKNKN